MLKHESMTKTLKLLNHRAKSQVRDKLRLALDREREREIVGVWMRYILEKLMDEKLAFISSRPFPQ